METRGNGRRFRRFSARTYCRRDDFAVSVSGGIYIVSCLRIDSKIVKTIKSVTFYLLEYSSRKWYFLFFIHLTLQKRNRRKNNNNFKKKRS